MIKSLRISNFKSWAEPPPIRFGRITGLFGPNSSGKSSVIQSLLLFKQTAESLDRTRTLHLGDDRSLIDLGTYNDLIYAHDVGLPLRWRIEWTEAEQVKIPDPSRKNSTLLASGDMAFEVTISQQGEGDALRIAVEKMEYQLGPASFGMTQKRDGYELTWGNEIQLKRRPGRPWPLPAPIKNYGFPDQVANYFQDAAFLSDLSFRFETLLSRISYVGPLRENPHRTYLWSGERPATVGPRGDQAVEALLAARSEGMKVGRDAGGFRARDGVGFTSRSR